MGSDIWFGDVVRAIGMLVPRSDREREMIYRLLGFDVSAPVNEGSPGHTPMPDPAAARDMRLASSPEAQFDAGHETSAAPVSLVPLLEPIAQRRVIDRIWNVQPLPEATAAHLDSELPHEPLLAPRSAAAMVEASVARQAEEGPPDVDAVVDAFARGLPVQHVRREPRSTMRFGVQVLVDIGQGMAPFARDQVELVEQISSLVGRERTSVQYFADAPLRGAGLGPGWTWGPYTPPDPGTCVVILSDLGISGPALFHHRSTVRDWAQLTELVGQRSCETVAFIPYPRSRCPHSLLSRMSVITWDRNTTVGAVFAARVRR
ncbi:hypothetical protein [Nocardia sp. CA-120079]|uniref:hypothetical protein n=1 Tax=Nocardia sp. CA-120079 TaxID=3239974 RepID=UPI003D97C7AA